MKNKLEPNFILYEKARSSKIVMSFYLCIKNMEIWTLKEGRETENVPFRRIDFT